MGSLDMSQNQNGISSRFSSQNSRQTFSIELPPKFAKLALSGREAKFRIRLHGAEGTEDLETHPSELAISFTRKYFNGFEFESESEAVKNIWVRKNAEDEHRSEFYEILREGTLLKWIRAQSENTVMILDDMRLEYLEELGSLSDLECGTLICCSSNTEKIGKESGQWREKGWHLPALKLERSYRSDFLFIRQESRIIRYCWNV